MLVSTECLMCCSTLVYDGHWPYILICQESGVSHSPVDWPLCPAGYVH